MNLEEVNDSILADLAGQHRTYFVTSLLSERLDRADLAEVVLYAYGTLAGQDEMEDFREPRPVREHEGFADCETSGHFWRGVCDQRGTFGIFINRRRRKKTARSDYPYPYFEIRGTQLLLGRLYDFFALYSPYPQAASELFLKQIDAEKGCVRLTGANAQMAVFNLYHCAPRRGQDGPRRRGHRLERTAGLVHRRRARPDQPDHSRPVSPEAGAGGRLRREALGPARERQGNIRRRMGACGSEPQAFVPS
ncbi:MAG: hypothetical protein LAP87_15375 [Acidobacteriia bacterium]|nr:hypothetical protein [Terriglobia bacterium]